MTSQHVRSSHWRGTVGWTSAIKGLCSLPNIDLLCCCVGSGIICKQYQLWSRGLLLFFSILLPSSQHFLSLSLLAFYEVSCMSSSVISPLFNLFPPPRSSSAMFGTRPPVPNRALWPDRYELAHFMSLAFAQRAPPWSGGLLSSAWCCCLSRHAQSVVINKDENRHLSSCVIWWYACSYRNTCMHVRIVILATGVLQAFAHSWLLFKRLSIVDGSANCRWSGLGWIFSDSFERLKDVRVGGRLEESPFCLVLPHASWVHNESLQALSFNC